MWDRNLGSYVWCGTGQQARPKCLVCNVQLVPVLFGDKSQLGGRGKSWIWGGDSPKPESPYWICNKCGVSYMKSGKDRLRFPTNSELDHHTNVGDTD